MYNSGKENGVYWYLDWLGDIMLIHVERIDDATKVIEDKYEFQYRPIFGFDWSDVNEINIRLDKYIKQLGDNHD